jgi:hypothetical protein
MVQPRRGDGSQEMAWHHRDEQWQGIPENDSLVAADQMILAVGQVTPTAGRRLLVAINGGEAGFTWHAGGLQ